MTYRFSLGRIFLAIQLCLRRNLPCNVCTTLSGNELYIQMNHYSNLNFINLYVNARRLTEFAV